MFHLYDQDIGHLSFDQGMHLTEWTMVICNQRCPISIQLYSSVIEPFLNKLRDSLTRFSLPGLSQSPPIVVSAYADDINIFIKNQRDIEVAINCLALYERGLIRQGELGEV